MKYARAASIAVDFVDTLRPFCERIQIGGSLRRERADVKDIEVVCIPKYCTIREGLFSEEVTRICPEFLEVVNSYPGNKGRADGKYTQRRLPQGINVDVFMCSPDNWGAIFLIRTGDWRFSKWFMGSALRRAGYEMRDGYVMRGEHRIAVPEEEDMFKLAGVPWVEPRNRTR